MAPLILVGMIGSCVRGMEHRGVGVALVAEIYEFGWFRWGMCEFGFDAVACEFGWIRCGNV